MAGNACDRELGEIGRWVLVPQQTRAVLHDRGPCCGQLLPPAPNLSAPNDVMDSLPVLGPIGLSIPAIKIEIL